MPLLKRLYGGQPTTDRSLCQAAGPPRRYFLKGRMATKINYENNIFYLQTLLKTTKTGLTLEIDADYFREKLAADIFFLASALSATYASLKANTHLIKKKSYLRSLLRTKRDFAELAQNILERKLPLASSLTAEFSRLKICRAEQTRDIEEIKAHIEKRGQTDTTVESEVISSEEFRFLLTPTEEPGI